jgi:hypothetical protein
MTGPKARFKPESGTIPEPGRAMKHLTPILIVLIFLPQAELCMGQDGLALKARMGELHSLLLNLNADLARDLPFPGSPQHQKVEVRMERFKSLAHRVTLRTDETAMGQLLPLLGEALPEQADQMTSAWKLGQTSYARALFRTLASTCMECHAAHGPRNPISTLIPQADLSSWSPIDRGRYFRSVGLPEKAFEEFSHVITQAKVAPDLTMLLEDALYEILALQIAISGSPERTVSVIRPLMDRVDLPRYLKTDLGGWIRDLETWKQEAKPKQKIKGSLLITLAGQHIRRARTLQESPTDRSSLVWYWRAVSELYAALKADLRQEQRAEALFLLGSAFEVLTPRHQETLHERLYEACIRTLPHTPRSDLCYRKLERSVIAGYTGSSGTRVPEEVRRRLLELWGTAFLKKGLELR